MIIFGSMVVEVDQSGKIEQLNTTTVVACANDESSSISVKASEKRLLLLRLRRSIVSKSDHFAIIFAVMVFLVLRMLKKIPSTIIIDNEYTGKDRIVCDVLEKLLLLQSKGRWHGIIRVGQIGKHSPAHVLAWSLHRKRKKRQGSKKVTASDILHWWQ